MSGEIALDTSAAIRFLNGDVGVTKRVLVLPEIILPMGVVGELLFGAENSTRPLQNLPRYLDFIEACTVLPLGKERLFVTCYGSIGGHKSTKSLSGKRLN
ncbi:hypothetical protein [Microcystis panniformis]|uniref:PIN domain-containing protein n=1 Tax=Microcystis panniformis FACHB-1757 TaxID=1638788 RepID=A0A0K1S9M4_9CHRO|nr:hypothetical protein [Microcystis panniformis]AKV70750.1 hypothetical protein VL20_5969 [Microcystis panniformis FACHB-1757]